MLYTVFRYHKDLAIIVIIISSYFTRYKHVQDLPPVGSATSSITNPRSYSRLSRMQILDQQRFFLDEVLEVSRWQCSGWWWCGNWICWVCWVCLGFVWFVATSNRGWFDLFVWFVGFVWFVAADTWKWWIMWSSWVTMLWRTIVNNG